MNSCQMQAPQIQVLAPALRMTKLKELRFAFNKFGSASGDALASLIGDILNPLPEGNEPNSTGIYLMFTYA